jgi:hypothetical protein
MPISFLFSLKYGNFEPFFPEKSFVIYMLTFFVPRKFAQNEH